MNHLLICHPRFDLGGRRGLSRKIDVVDSVGARVADFELMCSAIDEDIQTARGSGATALEEIRRIESGEIDLIESDGNGWVTYITRDKVWFEGLYSQGEGGEVSLAQYKLAVQTYVRFLADPERDPIEVPFPANDGEGFMQRKEPADQISTNREESIKFLRLICHRRTNLWERGLTRKIDVVDAPGAGVARFDLLCSAIDDDILSAEDSGACVLEWIRKVESGELEVAVVEGNAWVVNITRDKVWFEGLHGQGKGGEVSFVQYRLAVQTYLRFLADPDEKFIEVAFPVGDGDGFAKRQEPTDLVSPARPAMKSPDGLRLICKPGSWVLRPKTLKRGQVDLDLHVVDAVGLVVARFESMCEVICSGVHSARGSGADFLEGIRRVESGEVDLVESNGNGWVMHITRNKVWFKSLDDQGKAGEVSFEQYQLAVRTCLRILADPKGEPIEVEFPAH